MADRTRECRSCRETIHQKATRCPHCRAKQGWTLGAKVGFGFLCLMVLGALMDDSETKSAPEAAPAVTAPQVTKAEAPPKKRAAAPVRATPRSPKFDIDQIVARLRQPVGELPGVGGWERNNLADGTPRWMTTEKFVMYEVLPSKVTAMAGIAQDNALTALDALTGCIRINNAVFGKNATLPNQALPEMVDQVANSSEKVSRSFHGYTVTMSKVPELGFLVYAVAHGGRG